MTNKTKISTVSQTDSPAHYAHWPEGLPKSLSIPQTSLWYNLEVSATRYSDSPCLVYYDQVFSYRQVMEQAMALAAYLQGVCQVQRGDRVLLYMQNSPQFVIAYYAILRADAAVVPVNPMNKTAELKHYLADSGANVAVIGQELSGYLVALSNELPQHIIQACYADYAAPDTQYDLPEVVRQSRQKAWADNVVLWADAMANDVPLMPHLAGPDDACVIPYTSGTTGKPKGCLHTHSSVMFNTAGGAHWTSLVANHVSLMTLPLFHVTGMMSSMNCPIYAGSAIIVMTRWDREAAARMIEQCRVTHWRNITTMAIDFIGNPDLEKYDLSSLISFGGGGAAMPTAVATRAKHVLGLDYQEGYGMSETIAQTHVNPPQRLKQQCLGIPVFDTSCLVVDPATLELKDTGETGELLVSGPQVMRHYIGDHPDNKTALITIEGRRYLRTGDIGYVDDEGFYFIVDRLKRMINASGFVVSPAEVENILYGNPDIQEACVVGCPDERRGETVKAYIVLKKDAKLPVDPARIVKWGRDNMAAYKYPREVVIVESLPRSSTGKLDWRTLQEKEWAGHAKAVT